MGRQEELSAINRGKRLKHRLHRAGMNAIFRLFNEIDPLEVVEVGRQCQGKEPQSSIGCHPGGDLKSSSITNHKVTMLVVRALDCPDVLDIRKSRLEMVDPVAKTIRHVVRRWSGCRKGRWEDSGLENTGRSTGIVPIIERSLIEGFDYPRQVGAVGTEPVNPDGRARLPDQETVEDEGLHSLGEHLLEPGGNWEFGGIGGKVTECRLPRSKFEGRRPAFTRFLVNLGIIIVIPTRNLVDDRLGSPAGHFLRQDGGRWLVRRRKQLPLMDDGTGCFLQERFLAEDLDVFGLRILADSNLITNRVQLLPIKQLSEVVRDYRFDGQLEPIATTPPDEVLEVLSPVDDGRLGSLGDEPAQEGDDIQEGRLAASVGTDQHMERTKILPDIPQAAVVQRLDPSNHGRLISLMDWRMSLRRWPAPASRRAS